MLAVSLVGTYKRFWQGCFCINILQRGEFIGLLMPYIICCTSGGGCAVHRGELMDN